MSAAGDTSSKRFGTFGGVFTPSILTILGVIMFMRANFVIGNAGVFLAVLILALAKTITLTTSLSLSAISTNVQVRGGGAYFLISRVLGPEFGGAIGVAHYAALALSVPFYVLGFVEAFLRSYPSLEGQFLAISLGVAAVLIVIVFTGADWALKIQYVILGVLALAIVAFLGGAATQFSAETFAKNMHAAYSPQAGGEPYSFWLIFAIYFPAVTGIDAGLNMSGDLKDPARSLPRGTLAAVGVGLLVYGLQILICGGAYDRADLIDRPYTTLRDNALLGSGVVVVAGVFAATLSSAIGSCMGAPRVLQAVSRDRVLAFLEPFAKGASGTDEPRRALVLTAALTGVVLLWAGLSGGGGGSALNAVAVIITMFFLYTYGLTNLAAFIEAFGQNPSFRPRFRFFHWSVALVGCVGCVACAFLIDWKSAAGAVLMIAGLLAYLRKQQVQSTYADARRGFVFASLRKNLLRLSAMPEDARNWRPTILVFSGNPASREELVTYGVWLEAGRGVTILSTVLVGPLSETIRHRVQALEQLQRFCVERSVQAIPMVVVADQIGSGVTTTLQTAGFGPLRPNLVLFGWADKSGSLGNLGSFLRTAASLGMSPLLLRCARAGLEPLAIELHRQRVPERRVDVWWRGRRNGELMLLLAHLLSCNWEWSNTTVRVLRMVNDEAGREPALAALQDLILAARVRAKAEVLVTDRSFPQVLEETSGTAQAVFIGLQLPQPDEEIAWHTRYTELLDRMQGTVVLVHAASEEDLLLSE